MRGLSITGQGISKMKNYGCCWCGKLTDKGILDKEENKGCCCANCKDNYSKTDRYKEIEGLK